MAAVSGILGAVTSWAGTFNTSLLSGTRPAQFVLNMAGDDLDTTAFADSGTETHIKGLSSWSGSFTAQLASPSNGNLGLVTSSGGPPTHVYTTNINAWSMQAAANALEVTAFAGTTKTFIPGTINWQGTFSGYGDGTTALTAAGNSNEPVTLTLKYQEQGATDNQIAGTAFTTAMGVTVMPNAANAVNYSFRGTGNLTHATASAGTPVWGLGPPAYLVTPVAGDIVLTTTTDRTLTGSAFWTGISITVGVNQATQVTVNFQGSGALTIG